MGGATSIRRGAVMVVSVLPPVRLGHEVLGLPIKHCRVKLRHRVADDPQPRFFILAAAEGGNVKIRQVAKLLELVAFGGGEHDAARSGPPLDLDKPPLAVGPFAANVVVFAVGRNIDGLPGPRALETHHELHGDALNLVVAAHRQAAEPSWRAMKSIDVTNKPSSERANWASSASKLARLISRKWRPNFSAISSTHCRVKPPGTPISTLLTAPRNGRYFSSSPAMIVLPAPVSSASRKRMRGSGSM